MIDVRLEVFDHLLIGLFLLGCTERLARAAIARQVGRRTGRPLAQVVRVPVVVDSSKAISGAEVNGGLDEARDES
jgi:hypothetical protein